MQTATPTISQKGRTAQWLQWTYGPEVSERVAFARAMISIILLWLVYAAFQYSWQLVNQANSFGGPVYTLWPASQSDPTINRVSNWSITILRGFVAVAISLLVTKIGHKNACIFAMAMILSSFPFILTPLMKDRMIANGTDENVASEASYSLFIIFRLFLSVGGTAIMILQAPLIAKFFLRPKTRNAVAKCVNIPANATGVLCSMLFFNGVVASTATMTGPQLVASQWQLISGVFLIIVLVMFAAYMLVGMEFGVKGAGQKVEALSDADAHKNSFKWMFKQPHILMMLLAATFALYAGIEPGSGLLANFWKSQPGNYAHTWSLATGMPTGDPSTANTMFAWQIIYCLALFTGLLAMGKWSNTRYSQAKFSGIVIIVGAAFWGVSYGLGALNLQDAGIMAGVLIMGLIGSSCIFGTQSLTWAIPYRWGMTPKQITNYTSLSWTAMYIGYSILDIITAYAGTAGINANPGIVADVISADPARYQTLFDAGNLATLSAQTGTPVAELMATYYSSVRNVLLGTDWNTASAALGDKAQYFSAAGMTGILSPTGGADSIQSSLDSLSRQYVPQICVLSVIPVIPGVIYVCMRRTPDEIPFSFAHFRENHMHFSATKRLMRKWFKREPAAKEAPRAV